MKRWLLDFLKWGLIIVIAEIIGGIIFYKIYPKYHFIQTESFVIVRGNKITGKVEWGTIDRKWKEIGKYYSFEEQMETIIENLGTYIVESERKWLIKCAQSFKENNITPTVKNLRYALDRHRENQKEHKD